MVILRIDEVFFVPIAYYITPHDGSCGVCVVMSVAGIPDHGVEVFFVGPGCTTQIDVEFLGANFRGGDGMTDI